MVRNKKYLEDFEKNLIKNSPVDYRRNKKIFEALYKEAVYFGVLPLKNKLEGIEVKIKMAKALNSV